MVDALCCSLVCFLDASVRYVAWFGFDFIYLYSHICYGSFGFWMLPFVFIYLFPFVMLHCLVSGGFRLLCCIVCLSTPLIVPMPCTGEEHLPMLSNVASTNPRGIRPTHPEFADASFCCALRQRAFTWRGRITFKIPASALEVETVSIINCDLLTYF